MQYAPDVARNQVLNDYPLAPGCDYFSRSIKTPCLDTGVDIDGLTPDGRIYVSEDTVGEWARSFGWISPEEADALEATRDAATAKADRLQAEVDRLKDLEDALLSAGFVSTGEITEYPHHKGAGWWLLSNGETIRGNEDAAKAAQAKVDAGEVVA